MDIVTAEGVETALAVASTGVAYSKSFKLDYGSKFSMHYLAGSVNGAVDLKVELEESNVRPAAENAADSDNYVVPDGGMTIIANLTKETIGIIALSPVVAKYGRFKITGQGSNNADTLIAITVAKVEEHH